MPRKRPISRTLLGTTLILTILAWVPAIGAWGAEWFARTNGCALDHGLASSCVVAGRDYGRTLYSLSVKGWLVLITMPLMVLTGAMWVFIAARAVRRRG